MKTLLTIIGLGVVLGVGYYLFRDPIVNKYKQVTGGDTNEAISLATPVPTATIYPATATPFASTSPSPSASPSGTPLPSISDLKSGGTGGGSLSGSLAKGDNLPSAGPAENMALAGALSLASGGGLYYYRLRSRIKSAWKSIDIR